MFGVLLALTLATKQPKGFQTNRNKENVKFKHEYICYNCNKRISSGMYHIVNRYLTYRFCDDKCHREFYGEKAFA